MRELWGGVSELKSLMVIICAPGRHSGRHPPAAALRLGQHDEEGWLAWFFGPASAWGGVGRTPRDFGASQPFPESGNGKTGGHYARPTATARPLRRLRRFTRTRGRGATSPEFVFEAQAAHSRGGSATVALSAISARKTSGHYLSTVGLSRAR